jgi:HD-like signal output (HDOD) protein
MSAVKDADRYAEASRVVLSPLLGALFEAVDGEACRREIVGIVEHDPPIALAVLRVASTARFARRTPCRSLDEAVGRLGLRLLLEIVNNVAGAPLRVPHVEGYRLCEHGLWRQAIATAFACRAIAEKRGLSASRAYTVGLLVDVGKLALAEPLVRAGTLVDPETPFVCFERDLVGCDHAEVGAAIARRNHLPACLVDGIRFHHDPRGSDDLWCHLAHVGAGLAAQVLPEGVEGLSNPLFDESLDRLALSAADLLQILHAAVDGVLEADAWCAMGATR